MNGNGEVLQLLERIAGGIDGVRDELRGEMQGLRGELRSEMQALRTELRSEMHDLRQEMRTEIRGLRSDIQRVEQRMDNMFMGEHHSDHEQRIKALEERVFRP